MTDAAPGRTDIDIRRYGEVLLARWRVVVAATVLGVVIAAAALLIIPRTYSVSTTVSVSPITTDPFAANRNSNNLIDMNAEAVTASSFKVASLAAEASAGKWDAVDLRTATTVTPGVDSTTMTITVGAPSENLARTGAGAMADAFLEIRSDQAAASIEAGVARDSQSVQDYRAQLTDAIGRLADASPGSPAAAEASADQQILNVQISALVSRMSSLQGIDTTGGTILNPAAMTSVTVQPSLSLVLLTGLGVGFIGGIIAAFVTHSRRKLIRTPRELRSEADLDTLGLITQGGPNAAEEVGSVAQRIMRLAALNDARVIALVFDEAVPWPSTLVDQLAKSMRAAGTRAIVKLNVKADEKSPVVDLVLIPVGPTAPSARRLQALRVSDISIVIASAGASKVRSLKPMVLEAAEMGSPIAAAVLVAESRDQPAADSSADLAPEEQPVRVDEPVAT